MDNFINAIANSFEGSAQYSLENLCLSFAIFKKAPDVLKFLREELPNSGFSPEEVESFCNHLLDKYFVTSEGQLTEKAKERNICLKLT